MSKKKMLYLSLTLVVVAFGALGWKITARSTYESAEYKVLESDGDFEVRDYPDLMMATTGTKVSSQGNDGSFMRLFQYISGANEKEQKVAMTVPVFMEPDADERLGQMGFVIPKGVSLEGAPDPSDAEVQLRKRRGGSFAVVRFSGRMREDSLAREEVKLREWMNKKELNGNDQAEYAGYDPPWTPGAFRRNEVLIRLN